MSTAETAILLAGSIMEIMEIAILMAIACTPKYKAYIYPLVLISYIVISVPLFAKHFADTAQIRIILTFAVVVISSVICFKESALKKVIYALMITLCNTLISTAILIICMILGLDLSAIQEILNPTGIICRFIIVFGGLLFNIFVIHRIRKRIIENKTILYCFIAVIFTFVTTQMCILYIASYSHMYNFFLISAGILTTAASVIFVLLAFRSMKKVYLKEQAELRAREQHKFLCEKYDTLMSSYLEYKKLKHSFSDHLLIIDTLAKNNEADKLNEYIRKVHGEFCRLENVVFCRNTAVDIILADKYQLAADRHIKADFRISGIEDTGIDDIYICGILSNLLQNAVENTPTEKTVRLTTYIKANNLVIICENECDKPQTDISETSKPDKENHGYGIAIIKDIADRLGGGSLFEMRGTFFSAIITIPIGETAK